jgi:uncharacterized membrane protein
LLLPAFAAIALGIWFRFTNLDRKYLWFDEGHSAACVSGRPVQAINAMFDGGIRRLADLQQFLHLRPGEPTSTTITALVNGNPENAPLYFVLLRQWAELVGDSTARLRCLSALFSLLCLPLVFWFCLELFDSYATALTAAAWWSLSPFFVLYSQEARTYALFTLTTILAGVLLARAVRIGSRTEWAWYGLALVAGLYTHMMFALLIIAHAVFIVAYGRIGTTITNRRSLYVRFVATAAIAVASFLPWFYVFLSHARHDELSGFLSQRVGPHKLLFAWFDNIGAVFVDFGLMDFPGARVLAVVVAAMVTIAVGYSLWFLVRSTPRRAWMLLVATSLVPLLLVAISDLLFGYSRSEVARYWLPAYVGMGMSVSYWLSTTLAQYSRSAFAVAAILLVAATVSCWRSSQSTCWWNKGGVVAAHDIVVSEDVRLRNALAEIATDPQPLLVVQYTPLRPFDLLAMSTLVDPRIEWIGVLNPDHLQVPTDRDVVVYRSPQLVEHLRRQGKLLTQFENAGNFVRLAKEVSPLQAVKAISR